MRDGGFAYHNPVTIRFGADIYAQTLPKIIGPLSARVALFYGRNAMMKIGAIDRIKELLPNCEIEHYGGISPNPDRVDIEAVLRGWEKTDWVIGLGGGSVLDFAKSVAFLVNQDKPLRTFLGRDKTEPVQPSVPVVALPTTSGTGSEVTPWATVWSREEDRKYSLHSSEMFPKCAIVDPSLTVSLPPYTTAYTGFDALSHALEAFWSRHANPVSDLYAVEAIGLILAHLGPVMDELDDIGHRAALAQASLFAGMAFSNTKTTAVHSVSYPMTLHYGVPHGVACSLTLSEFSKYNLGAIDPAKVSRLLARSGDDDPEMFAQHIEALAHEVGLPVTLEQAGIPREGVEVILAEGFHPERVVNNPRQLSHQDLREMLERIYE